MQMNAPASLAELAAISQWAGADVLLAQGGGGNTSVKSADGSAMWIKASGFRLAEVTAERGHLAVDLPNLLGVLRSPELLNLPDRAAHERSVALIQETVKGESKLRPSLETSFHAVLGRVVLHTHPVYVNAFTCMEGGRAALAEALGEEPVWVPYYTPGYVLGREVDRAAQKYRAKHGRLPAAIVLENHGLIASGDSAEEVIAVTKRYVEVGKRAFGEIGVDYSMSSVSSGRLCEASLTIPLDSPGPLVPDDVVCGVHAIRPPGDDPRERGITRAAGGYRIHGPTPTAVRNIAENLLANLLIHHLIARRGRPRLLPDGEVAYLAGMDSEKYRQAVAANALSGPRPSS